MSSKRLAGVLLALGWLGTIPTAAEEREVYRRAAPTEMETGIVRAGSNLEALVTLPRECDGKPLGCRHEVRVDVAHRIDFFHETLRTSGGNPSEDTEPRGQILLALRMEQRDAVVFQQDLYWMLRRLPAEAFRNALAGLTLMSKDFPDIASRSREPSWACAKAGAAWELVGFKRKEERKPDGTVQITSLGIESFGKAPEVEEICQAFSDQTVGYPSIEIRSRPSLRRVEETAVSVQTHSRLVPEAAPGELLALPRGTRYFIRSKPGVRSGGSIHVSSEGSLATLSQDGIETTAFVAPADLPPDAPVVNAWISRWTVERWERTFGPDPEEERLARESLVYVLLPTLPPRQVSDDESEGDEGSSEAVYAPSSDAFPPAAAFAVILDTAALVSRVARELAGREKVSVGTLEDVLQAPPAGTGDAVGWAWVLCRAHGGALWGLAPTAARARLRNADLFCGTAEAQLP